MAAMTLEVDEMWHFVETGLPGSGSGVPVTWISGEPWPGCWVSVMMRPAAGSSTRSG